MYAIIGTWKMSFEGIRRAGQGLGAGGCAADAISEAIRSVEDDPRYVSVGYGGLPARDGHVTLDAAYMDGQTLRYGAILCAENIRNPILAAMLLSKRSRNCVLAARGAERFAVANCLETRPMLTEASERRWRVALAREGASPRPQAAYQGHDTVCVIALDTEGRMGVGTSTSGLFMKEPGRVGDTPVIGSGFYCDARFGAAAATGLGEDIMRGCLSYEAVSLMRRGATPQAACDEALHALLSRMRELGETDGGISLVAMRPDGSFGASTSLEVFPFVTACAQGDACLHTATYGESTSVIRDVPASEMASVPGD